MAQMGQKGGQTGQTSKTGQKGPCFQEGFGRNGRKASQGVPGWPKAAKDRPRQALAGLEGHKAGTGQALAGLEGQRAVTGRP